MLPKTHARTAARPIVPDGKTPCNQSKKLSSLYSSSSTSLVSLFHCNSPITAGLFTPSSTMVRITKRHAKSSPRSAARLTSELEACPRCNSQAKFVTRGSVLRRRRPRAHRPLLTSTTPPHAEATAYARRERVLGRNESSGVRQCTGQARHVLATLSQTGAVSCTASPFCNSKRPKFFSDPPLT